MPLTPAENEKDFLAKLNEPEPRDPPQLLNQLQNTDFGSFSHFEEPHAPILPLELYLKLEKRRKESREVNLEAANSSDPIQSQLEIQKMLVAECEHIHNKVLFDCVNDSLLQFKPYGREGTPMPWDRRNRKLKASDDFSLVEIFEIVKHDVSAPPSTPITPAVV